ncbi:HD domain-containing protein [Nocardioides jishulii]|uniref:HD domain-containing protein n=1 Tax=Nocardioides jishulii TaxID=2575440 RepID=UPI001EEF7DFA|nr:HD domain-containing protein [Nocardioides jishulii]
MSSDPAPPPSLAAWWPLPGRTDLRDALTRAYASSSRGHHGLTHLSEVLAHLDELADHVDDLATVRLAAWFHDAVYDAEPDPEGRSAAWAERELAEHPERAEVVRLVLLTRDHDPAPGDRDGEALCDADLAILAAPSERYDEYAAGVRHEYATVPDALFRQGRAEVLRTLLQRPALFRTAHGRAAWEDRARDNVARELQQLSRPAASDDAGRPGAGG